MTFTQHTSAALLLGLFLSAPAAGQGTGCPPTWTPLFQLATTTTRVAVGNTFNVDIHVSGVADLVGGYQAEIVFDPTLVQPTAIAQGPYLPFNTFFGFPAAFPNKVRVGGLQFPSGGTIPPPPPIGNGAGVIATVTFLILADGPVHLNLTPFCLFSVPTGACSVPGDTQDYVLQATLPGQILGVSGVPNPGGSLSLAVLVPGFAGSTSITAGSLSFTMGIPIAGVGGIPLDWDLLFNLAIANAPPWNNTVNILNGNGASFTGFAIPPISGLVGIRLWFASVVVDPGGIQISNSTFVDIIDP